VTTVPMEASWIVPQSLTKAEAGQSLPNVVAATVFPGEALSGQIQTARFPYENGNLGSLRMDARPDVQCFAGLLGQVRNTSQGAALSLCVWAPEWSGNEIARTVLQTLGASTIGPAVDLQAVNDAVSTVESWPRQVSRISVPVVNWMVLPRLVGATSVPDLASLADAFAFAHDDETMSFLRHKPQMVRMLDAAVVPLHAWFSDSRFVAAVDRTPDADQHDESRLLVTVWTKSQPSDAVRYLQRFYEEWRVEHDPASEMGLCFDVGFE
jgi:hypothetical protein